MTESAWLSQLVSILKVRNCKLLWVFSLDSSLENQFLNFPKNNFFNLIYLLLASQSSLFSAIIYALLVTSHFLITKLKLLDQKTSLTCFFFANFVFFSMIIRFMTSHSIELSETKRYVNYLNLQETLNYYRFQFFLRFPTFSTFMSFSLALNFIRFIG